MNLIISDLHLSDNPLEEYRWKVFNRLYTFKDIETVYILGDLTEKKDNHGAKLVNRLVNHILPLRDRCKRMVILRGNHDGIDPEWPFFGFLHAMNIEYYYRPYILNDEMFIPYSKTFQEDITSFNIEEMLKVKRIFIHQTVRGAKVNDISLEGFNPDIFRDFTGLMFAGDIHIPQTIGKINYVGSPYPVYFGDDFVGGCILLDGDKWERAEYQTISRVMLDLDLTKENYELPFVEEGDQFKIRMLVKRSDSDQFDLWKKNVRKVIEDRKGVVVSMELKLAEEKSRLVRKRKFKDISPESVLKRYCAAESLDQYYYEKGMEFI